MRIDIHTHATETVGLSRQNGTRFPTPDEHIAMLDEAGIDKAVLLSTMNPEVRYSYVTPDEVMRIHRRYPDRIIPFCSLDPRFLTNSPEADFRPMLHHLREAGFVGVGEYMPNLPLDDELNLNLFRQVEEAGLPLTFHLAPRVGGYYGCVDELGLPRLERVLQLFPNLVFLAHSQVFWAEIGSDVTEETRGGYPHGPVAPGRVVELMRRYPNLHGDLSAQSGFNAISRDPEFGCRFMEEFRDRLYFGTDIANAVQELPIVAYFNALRANGTIDPEILDMIEWKNAARLFGLHIENEKK